MINRVKKIKKCRICGNKELVNCINLGNQYLSSVFPQNLDYKKNMQKFPLELVLCQKNEKTCGLLQLAHNLDLTSMYELYPYSSSVNPSMKIALKDIVDSVMPYVALQRKDVVLDIGGNDGTLLSFFKENDLRLFSIDPAKNMKQVFKSPKYKYINEFFNKNVYKKEIDKKANLIFSIAMFYHLSDPIKFSRDVKACLTWDGIWVIQMAYLPSMIETNMYDNIVHEHVGYYTLHNMLWIMEKAGLEVFDASLNDVYGGSFRIFVKTKNNKLLKTTERMKNILQNEKRIGVDKVSTYTSFMKRVKKTKNDLLNLVDRINRKKEKIWIYGASTKGNTILQYCGLTKNEIVAAADSNPFKFGRYIIGADIPIKDEKQMRKAKPNYLLALPYSFIDGFMEREIRLIESGTRFILPLPNVSIAPHKF